VSEIEYLVEPDGANWKVRLQSEDSFPYGTLEEAIEAATEAARGARKCGFSAEVFVRRAQGGWTSVWGERA
jgi:hypothetical protein